MEAGSSRDNQSLPSFGGDSSSNDPQAEHQVTVFSAVGQAFFLFSKMLAKLSPVILSNLIVMCAIYLPAFYLGDSTLAKFDDELYDYGIAALMVTTSWTSISFATAYIFSFNFAKRAILYAFIPAFAKNCVLYITPSIKSISYIWNIGSVLDLPLFAFGMFLVAREEAPSSMTQEQASFYDLTKDGSPLALLKGIIGFYLFVGFIFYNILAMFLDVSFNNQIAFRFIVFPLCFKISKLFQKKVIFGLSKEQMDRRLIVYKMCNHLIQFIGRVLISNLLTNSGSIETYVLINIATLFLEVFATVSFAHRTRLLYRANVKWSIFKGRVFRRKKEEHEIEAIALDDIQVSNPPQLYHALSAQEFQAVNHELRAEEQYMQEATDFRSKYIYDDMGSEVYSLIMASLLMYFLHPIRSESSEIQTISSLEKCAYQILIQLFFELIGDVLALSYEIYHGRIHPQNFDEWNPIHPPIMFLWSLYCVFQMHMSFLAY